MWRPAIILCLCTFCLAGPSPPGGALELPASQEAIHRFQLSESAARQAFYHSMIEADEREISDLQRAMKVAMNVANLGEANRLQVAINDANEVLKQHKQALEQSMAPPTSQIEDASAKFVIFAHDRWTMTISVRKGQRYRVTASGQWSGGTDLKKNRLVCGPEGMVIPDGDHQGNIEWYLEGRINHKYPFVIGARCEFTAQEDGPLEMQMRNWWIYGSEGSIEAVVQHLPSIEP